MTAEMETMAESLDTLHVEVLDGRGLLAGAVSYSVALSVGFYTKGTPYVPAVSGGASWRHRLQIPRNAADDVLKVALVAKRPGADDAAEVARAMVELRDMGALLEQPGTQVKEWVALTKRDSAEACGAIQFVLRFQRAAGAVPNRAASVDSSLPAGWRPTPYDRLAGSWRAAGVADHGTEVEEEFVLKVAQEQLADGSWSSSCTGSNEPGGEEEFSILALSFEGAAPNQRVTFIQRYPDGAETHWAAFLAEDHSSMHTGTWRGACNGTFTCTHTVHENSPAPAPVTVSVPEQMAEQVPPNALPAAPVPAVSGPKTPTTPQPPVQPQTMTPPAPEQTPATAVSPSAPKRPSPEAVAAALAGAGGPQQKMLEQEADRFEELSQALEHAMREKPVRAAVDDTATQQQQVPADPRTDPGAPEAAAPALNAAQLRRQRQLEAQRRHAERLGSPSRPRRGTSPGPGRRSRAGSPAPNSRPPFGGSGRTAGTSPRRPKSRSGSPAASRAPFGRASSPAHRSSGRASSARNMARSNSPAPLPRVATLGPGHIRRAVTSPDRSRAGSASGRYRSQSPAAPRGFGSSSRRIPTAREELDGVGPSLSHGDLESGVRLTSPERLGSPSRSQAPDFYHDPLVGRTVLARFPRDNTWKEAVVQKPVRRGRKYMVDFTKQRVVEVVDRTSIVEMDAGQLRRRQEQLGSPQQGSAAPTGTERLDDPLMNLLEQELFKAEAARPGAPNRSRSISRNGRAKSASRFPSQQRANRLNSPGRSARLGSPDRRARLGSPDRRNARLGSPDRRSARLGSPERHGARANSAHAGPDLGFENLDEWSATHLHLDDSQMQRFVAEGFCALEGGPGLSSAFHARMARHCEALRLHEAPSPLLTDNLLNVLPELLHVYGSKPVACALESLLGRNYILHPRQETHATIPGTECEVWHRGSFGGRYGRRQHRLRRVCALYFPHTTTIELGSLDVAAGSQYCTLRSHNIIAALAREMDHNAPDAKLIDWLAVDGFPDAWGTSKQLVLPAGAVVLMHADLWKRVAANVSAQQRRFCVTAHFMRTEEPTGPTWRHLSPAWTIGTRPGGVPALKPLWWSVWSWLCGGIAPGVVTSLDDNQDFQAGDVQSLSASLHWSTVQGLVPPARTVPPSSYSARAGEEAAALSMALASAHSTAIQAKLAKAQMEAVRAERQIRSLKRASDEAAVESAVIGSHGEGGGKPSTLLHEIEELKTELATKMRISDELSQKAAQEQQKTSVAKEEALKLRKDLRKAEADMAKVRSKCDGLHQTHLQMQSRLMTVATAVRQNKPWEDTWDAWLPASAGGGFSPRFREARVGGAKETPSGASAGELEQEPMDVYPSKYSPSANVLRIGDSPKQARGAEDSSFGLTSWGGEHEAGVGGGWADNDSVDGSAGGFVRGDMHQDAEPLSPALRSGNRELEIELRVQEGVEARVLGLREKLQGVALSAFARSRQFRLLRCIFSDWIDWVSYRVHREGVQRRAIQIMRKSTRMKVWRAWMGWAAAKQMEERFDELKQQVAVADALDDDSLGQGSALSDAASAGDAAADPYRDAESTGRPLEGSLQLPESANVPSRGSHRVDEADLEKEVACLRAAYTLAAAHGVDGAQILLQRALSPPSSTQHDAAGDVSGRAAGFGLVALPPRMAAAVQPKLAIVLCSAHDPETREFSAWVLGEWATMPGACNDEVLKGLTTALAGDGSRRGVGGAGDPVPGVRAAAAEALGNLGAALAMRARLSGDAGVSRGLAMQLEQISTCLQSALVPTVAGARQDGESLVALAVTVALLRIGPAARSATEGLTTVATCAANREVRATAAEALRRLRTQGANEALLRPMGGKLPPGGSLAPVLPMPAR